MNHGCRIVVPTNMDSQGYRRCKRNKVIRPPLFDAVLYDHELPSVASDILIASGLENAKQFLIRTPIDRFLKYSTSTFRDWLRFCVVLQLMNRGNIVKC